MFDGKKPGADCRDFEPMEDRFWICKWSDFCRWERQGYDEAVIYGDCSDFVGCRGVKVALGGKRMVHDVIAEGQEEE